MTARSWRRGSAVAAGAMGVSLALAACGGSSTGTNTASGSGSADCAAFSSYGTFTGSTVNIFSSIRDVEATNYGIAFKDFEKCTGITIKWEGSGEFESQLPVRVDGGTAPDLATFPQPGLLATMVAKGAVKPLDDTAKALATANYSADWLKYGTVKGVLYAAPNSANVKSFVWYSPKMFKDNGWTVPTTWDEMIALSDKIAATKVKPWCAGFESGTATGWPGTDWIEDVMLRTGGADNYDKWVNHQIPFNDPTVAAAFDKVGTILKNEKYVNGGYGSAKTIASTSFQDGGLPILAGDCAMHRQASFYSGMWPKGTNVGPDGSIFAFYFPTIDPAKGNPVLGGGEIIGAFNDKKPTKAVQNYMMSGDFVNKRAKLSNFLSANKQLDQANLLLADGKTVDPIMQLSAKILQDPKTVFRFDGSDMMPSAVGSGTFWKGMTNWITGQSTKQVVDTIEASWPKS